MPLVWIDSSIYTVFCRKMDESPETSTHKMSFPRGCHFSQQARKPRSYASPKLWPSQPLTDRVKCRATYIARNHERWPYLSLGWAFCELYWWSCCNSEWLLWLLQWGHNMYKSKVWLRGVHWTLTSKCIWPENISGKMSMLSPLFWQLSPFLQPGKLHKSVLREMCFLLNLAILLVYV